MDDYRVGYNTYLAQVELIDGDTLLEYGLEINGVLRQASNMHGETNEFIISTLSNWNDVRAYAIIHNGVEFETLFGDNKVNAEGVYVTDFSIPNIDTLGINHAFGDNEDMFIVDFYPNVAGKYSIMNNRLLLHGEKTSGNGNKVEIRLSEELEEEYVISKVIFNFFTSSSTTILVKVDAATIHSGNIPVSKVVDSGNIAADVVSIQNTHYNSGAGPSNVQISLVSITIHIEKR